MPVKTQRMAEERPTKWVSFDCYGTLIDWLGGFTAILKPTAGELTSSLLHTYHRCEPQIEAESYRPYREILTTSLLRAAREIGM